MSPYLVERLAELRRHLDHLAQLRPRISGRAALERDLSLHNDVLFSLLTVCQLVIDVAGDLSAQRGDRFEDYTEAMRNLARDSRFPPELVSELGKKPCQQRKRHHRRDAAHGGFALAGRGAADGWDRRGPRSLLSPLAAS